MAEDGGHYNDGVLPQQKAHPTLAEVNKASSETEIERHSEGPMSPRNFHRNPFSRSGTKGSLEMDDYFVGPRDTMRHSKWPTFLRMHGSILPEMVLPLFFVGGWATLVTCISQFVYPLVVNPLLLTVLGFVVGLGLSFRSSTAYERYAEGRKYWAQLTLSSHNLARCFWIHGGEREGELGKQDLLGKITALNLIVAFAMALKHKLRFEPYTHYEDLAGLVGHLNTFAQEATTPEVQEKKKVSTLKATGQYLGVSFAESNPRKAIKKSDKPLGNLPLEILTYLGAYVDEAVDNGNLKVPTHQVLSYNNIAALNDVLTGTERILNTPLPVAYNIAIAQITWVYVFLLPFQLFKSLEWVTIPGSIFAAYIILGIMFIGKEIENPFGHDVNDLPLDLFCQQIAHEIDIIASIRKPDVQRFVKSDSNKLLFPISDSGYPLWANRSEKKIRDELRAKVQLGVEARKSMQAERPNPQGEERV